MLWFSSKYNTLFFPLHNFFHSVVCIVLFSLGYFCLLFKAHFYALVLCWCFFHLEELSDVCFLWTMIAHVFLHCSSTYITYLVLHNKLLQTLQLKTIHTYCLKFLCVRCLDTAQLDPLEILQVCNKAVGQALFLSGAWNPLLWLLTEFSPSSSKTKVFIL